MQPDCCNLHVSCKVVPVRLLPSPVGSVSACSFRPGCRYLLQVPAQFLPPREASCIAKFLKDACQTVAASGWFLLGCWHLLQVTARLLRPPADSGHVVGTLPAGYCQVVMTSCRFWPCCWHSSCRLLPGYDLLQIPVRLLLLILLVL